MELFMIAHSRMMFFPLLSRYPALTLGTTTAPYVRPNVLLVGEIEGLELKVYVTGMNECFCFRRQEDGGFRDN